MLGVQEAAMTDAEVVAVGSVVRMGGGGLTLWGGGGGAGGSLKQFLPSRVQLFCAIIMQYYHS